MRRDIVFARNVMQSEFDVKLREKVNHLYIRTNERLTFMEKTHDERVLTVRRAFRQQLADALVRLQSLFSTDLEQKMRRERKKKDKDKGRQEDYVKGLLDTIKRNESVVDMLKAQVREMRATQLAAQASREEEDAMSSQRTHLSSSRAPSVNPAEEQLEASKKEIAKLEKQVNSMLDSLEAKDKDIDDIQKQMEKDREELEKEKILIEQMRMEFDANNAASESDMTKANQMMALQRGNMQKKMDAEIEKAKEKAYNEAMQQAVSSSSNDALVIKSLQDEKKIMEQQLTKEEKVGGSSKRDTRDSVATHSSQVFHKLLSILKNV